MDRRQRKTRTAIYSAFIELLGNKDFSKITVQEIIETADVGRATFYAHFETKDYLLREMCEELFGHILGNSDTHYDCDIDCSFFLHLLRHLKNNDDNILKLLSGRNNELFLGYFKQSLKTIIENVTDKEALKELCIPEDYFANYITAVFTDTVLWWAKGKFVKSPEQISAYFDTLVGEKINNYCKFS